MCVRSKFVKIISFLIWVACIPTLTLAQTKDETLADLRQELIFLNTEIQLLNRELSTTSGGAAPTGSGTLLQRADALEQELRRITDVVEQLQFRLERVVQDGTNRLGDMQFRIIELEGGDVSNMPNIPVLGGENGSLAITSGNGNQSTSENTGVELAASEQGDFDRAVAVVEEGNYADAVAKFDQFLLTYPGSPLTSEVHYWRAEALVGQNDWSNAARAFLESFSGSPSGVKAARSLYRLGVSLAELGQTQDACATLGEVGLRYPTAQEADEARSEMTALNCL
jgi:tol-pal system protein YbgF